MQPNDPTSNMIKLFIIFAAVILVNRIVEERIERQQQISIIKLEIK